jgi:hypothetical protein
MKKISIKESDLKIIIQETLNDPSISLTPQEKKLQGVFGRYEPEVSGDVLRYMRKNPRLILQRLIDIYGDKFFTMVDIEKQKFDNTQGPLDEQVEDEFYYDAAADKRKDINDYIQFMMPVIRGEESFNGMNAIEIDFYRYDKTLVDLEVNLTLEVPDTGNKRFDQMIAKKAVEYFLNEANDGMDRNELRVNSILLK